MIDRQNTNVLVGEIGPRLMIIRVVLPLIMGLVAYAACRIWRRKVSTGSKNGDIDFRPTIGFTRQDGWVSLAVMLLNRSDRKVWAEEVEVVLIDLKATGQTAAAPGQEIHPIRQTVGPGDMLPISLVEAIYKAAGEPQRRYSCFLSAIVRYRAGDQWFEKTLQTQNVKMAGFKVRSTKRVRWYMKKPESSNIPQNLRTPEHEDHTRSTPATTGRAAR